MDKRIAITGASGFLGSHLAEAISNPVLFSRNKTDKYLQLTDHLDLSSYDIFYHLSAQASVHVSFEKPFETITDNVFTTLSLLNNMYDTNRNMKLVIAGSAEVYKSSLCRLTEEDLIEPRNLYGMTKQLTDIAIQYISKQLKLNTTILRTFNITGPRQATKFALSSFAKQIVDIEKGINQPVIRVGNLEAKRDFLDYRDYIQAALVVANSEEQGEVYNICSGEAYSMRELLERLIKLSGITVKIEIDPERLRPSDVPIYVGDNTKFKKRFGWKPKYTIDDTLISLLEYWRTCKN